MQFKFVSVIGLITLASNVAAIRPGFKYVVMFVSSYHHKLIFWRPLSVLGLLILAKMSALVKKAVSPFPRLSICSDKSAMDKCRS
jgi:hypothetical protein